MKEALVLAALLLLACGPLGSSAGAAATADVAARSVLPSLPHAWVPVWLTWPPSGRPCRCDWHAEDSQQLRTEGHVLPS